MCMLWDIIYFRLLLNVTFFFKNLCDDILYAHVAMVCFLVRGSCIMCVTMDGNDVAG